MCPIEGTIKRISKGGEKRLVNSCSEGDTLNLALTDEGNNGQDLDFALETSYNEGNLEISRWGPTSDSHKIIQFPIPEEIENMEVTGNFDDSGYQYIIRWER